MTYREPLGNPGDAQDADLDPLESLTGDDPDEPMQTGYSPPERQPRSLRNPPTAAETRSGPSLDEQLAEEEPDVSPDDIAFDDADPRAGRLVAPNEGFGPDDEADEIATDVGPAGYASSAEEAAMHVRDEE